MAVSKKKKLDSMTIRDMDHPVMTREEKEALIRGAVLQRVSEEEKEDRKKLGAAMDYHKALIAFYKYESNEDKSIHINPDDGSTIWLRQPPEVVVKVALCELDREEWVPRFFEAKTHFSVEAVLNTAFTRDNGKRTDDLVVEKGMFTVRTILWRVKNVLRRLNGRFFNKETKKWEYNGGWDLPIPLWAEPIEETIAPPPTKKGNKKEEGEEKLGDVIKNRKEIEMSVGNKK